jgi:hypothetical protein
MLSPEWFYQQVRSWWHCWSDSGIGLLEQEEQRWESSFRGLRKLEKNH